MLYIHTTQSVSSVTQSCPTPCNTMTAACQASLFFIISWSLLKLMFIESVMLSNCLILCPLLLFLPSIFPSIRGFPNESNLHIRWPKYWSFSFSTSSSNEYSGLISFRIGWFDLLAVQRTLWNQEVWCLQLYSFHSRLLCYSSLLWFHTNYRIFFLLLLKNIIGILMVIALKSVDQSSIFG